MGEPLRHYAKQNNPVPRRKVVLHCTQIKCLRLSKSQNQKVEKAGRKGEGEFVFNEYRVSILQDEKNSKDLLHNNVNVFNTTLSNGEDGKFNVLCFMQREQPM